MRSPLVSSSFYPDHYGSYSLPLIAQETERRQENEKLLKALNDQFEIEKVTLKLMEDFETDQRKLEHDFNNQMMVVMGMMEMGEMDGRGGYAGEMEKRIRKA